METERSLPQEWPLKPVTKIKREAGLSILVLCACALAVASCSTTPVLDEALKPVANPAVREYIKQGVEAGARYDFKAEMECYNKAVETDPGCEKAYSYRGCLRQRLEYNDEAIADFTKVLSLNPTNKLCLGGRAYCYLQKNEFDLSIRDCAELERMDAGHPTLATHLLSLINIAKQAFEDAAKDADATDEVKDKTLRSFYYQRRAVAYMQKKDFDRAITDIGTAIRMSPSGGARCHYWKAKIFDEAKKPREALVSYREFMEQAFDDPTLSYRTIFDFDQYGSMESFLKARRLGLPLLEYRAYIPTAMIEGAQKRIQELEQQGLK